MENASKALIIAASVLVSILIIAMGVRIFSGAQSAADTSTLDQMEIVNFNSKFERYSDTQLGSQVKSLVSFLVSNASTNKDEKLKLPTVELYKNSGVTGGSSASKTAKGGTDACSNIKNYTDNLGNIRKEIVSTHSYYVDMIYGDAGIINTIRIYYNK